MRETDSFQNGFTPCCNPLLYNPPTQRWDYSRKGVLDTETRPWNTALKHGPETLLNTTLFHSLTFTCNISAAAAGTRSQKSAYVRAGNFLEAARPMNVTFNGSNTTSCDGFRSTDWVRAWLHDGEHMQTTCTHYNLLPNTFKYYVPMTPGLFGWTAATLPLLATENIYTVVIDDTDVGKRSVYLLIFSFVLGMAGLHLRDSSTAAG